MTKLLELLAVKPIAKAPTIALAALLLSAPVVVSGCGQGQDAKELASKSCRVIDSSKSHSIGDVIRDFKRSSRLAARAAAIDSRWTPLVASMQQEADELRDWGHALGMGTDIGHLNTLQTAILKEIVGTNALESVSKALQSMNTQCAIAKA